MPALADWPRAQVVPRTHNVMIPGAQRITRLNCNFILPPSLAVREQRGAVWRSKQIGGCAVSCGLSFGRAHQFEGSLRLVRPADTIRLPASARNGSVAALGREMLVACLSGLRMESQSVFGHTNESGSCRV